MSILQARVADLFKRCLTARPKESLLTWAKRHVVLSEGESGDFPGAYDPDLNPLPTLLFDLYQSGEYDEVIVKKSSQSGWTLVVFIFIAWWVTFVRRNFLYAIDSEEEVEKISTERMQPLLKRCAPAAGRMRAGAAAFTKVVLRFAGITGYLSGAKSLGKVSNKSVGLAIIDEISALEASISAKQVAANVAEIRARLKRQALGFLISLSKPRDWHGIINQEFLKGTRHKCFVPCPHCTADAGRLDGWQVIEWEQIKFGHCKDMVGHWDYDRMERETFLECTHCKRAIVEREHKPWMVANRDWRRTNFGDDPDNLPEPRRASVEQTDLYSTFPNLSWGRLAVRYVKALGDAEALKNFFRDHLARPDKPTAVQTEESIIHKMTAGYRRGQLPIVPRKVVMGVDKQQNVWKWVKAAFNFEGEAWVIDWGTVLNPDTLVEEADRPVEILRWPESIPEAERINPTTFKGLVDERFDQKIVRDFLISTLTGWADDGTPDYRFHACYGLARHTARSMKDIVWPGPFAKPNAIHNQHPLWTYAISTDSFNAEIHRQRFGRFNQIIAARNDGRPPPADIRRIHFPMDLDPQFVKEITRERFEFDTRTKRWQWADVTENDFGDGLRMCFAAWYLLAPLEEAPPPISAPTAMQAAKAAE